MRTWHDKAKEIIARHSLESYRQANILPNGQKRKRHVPYSIPEIATSLVNALNTNDEHEAKRLFEVERLGAWSLI
jgi:hypothetical protein